MSEDNSGKINRRDFLFWSAAAALGGGATLVGVGCNEQPFEIGTSTNNNTINNEVSVSQEQLPLVEKLPRELIDSAVAFTLFNIGPEANNVLMAAGSAIYTEVTSDGIAVGITSKHIAQQLEELKDIEGYSLRINQPQHEQLSTPSQGLDQVIPLENVAFSYEQGSDVAVFAHRATDQGITPFGSNNIDSTLTPRGNVNVLAFPDTNGGNRATSLPDIPLLVNSEGNNIYIYGDENLFQLPFKLGNSASGAPVVSNNGKLIGVCSYIFEPKEGEEVNSGTFVSPIPENIDTLVSNATAIVQNN